MVEIVNFWPARVQERIPRQAESGIQKNAGAVRRQISPRKRMVEARQKVSSDIKSRELIAAFCVSLTLTRELAAQGRSKDLMSGGLSAA